MYIYTDSKTTWERRVCNRDLYKYIYIYIYIYMNILTANFKDIWTYILTETYMYVHTFKDGM